ncbi:hypothetical protein IB265_28405 [Ensifer sp. ENS10]|uniref:hypothetical protein n=1 Tax=unclassified Ensifer TaxID=2633371 RepID=UPI000DDD9D0A|nr:hypothetical protein [Ensifer sp. ENS10]MBD9510692.1 hypothetical protein [Ensifer sp. ENS10]
MPEGDEFNPFPASVAAAYGLLDIKRRSKAQPFAKALRLSGKVPHQHQETTVDILHTPTIMLSSFATLVVFAVFFGLAWRQERKSLELLLWSSAFSIGAVGFVLLTLRGDGYNFVTISLGNALAVLALAMIWLGLRAFVRRACHRRHSSGGAVFAEILKGRLSAEIAEPLLIFRVVRAAP